MASNWELQLISAILSEEDLDTPERIFRIDSSSFISDEAAAMFDSISKYWHKKKHWGEVPPLRWIEERFPTIQLPEQEATIAELCDLVKQNYVRRRLFTISDRLYDLAEREDDPENALNYLLQETKEFTRLVSPEDDIDFGKTAFREIKKEVEVLEESKGLLGLPWPWQLMNDETQGLENGGLYILYARPKSMKTWLMLYIATNLYVNFGLRVMVWCREMTPEQMRRRIAMIVGGIDYSSFRQGTLTAKEKTRLFDCLEMLQDEYLIQGGQKLKITKGSFSDNDNAQGSIAELRAKAEEFQPQLIVADSPYHMQASSKWRDITDLARSLKGLAADLNVPLICTWQANREGEKTMGKNLSEIALGDALAQEADMLCRILKRGTKKEPKLSLVIPGAREFAFEGFTINGKPGGDFTFLSEEILWEDKEEEVRLVSPGSRSGGRSRKSEALANMPRDLDQE